MDVCNKNLTMPPGWRISVRETWAGTGNGDDRLALGLYRWEKRVIKRLFRKPVTQTGWFLTYSGRDYSLTEKDRTELIMYARDTVDAEAQARSQS